MSSDDEAPRPPWDAGGPHVQAALAALAARGFDAEAGSEVVTSVSRILAEQLADARGEGARLAPIGLMRSVLRLGSNVVRGAREGARLPIAASACAVGCAHCCRVHVSVTPPEAFVLAAFLRDTRADLAAVTARVVEAAERVRSMDQDARLAAKLACPLLEGERCAAYPARPLACAGANSFDAAACARGGEIPLEPLLLGGLRATSLGLSVALAARGLDAGRYELAHALAVALTVPDAAARWLAGERLFTATPADPEPARLAATHDAFVARDPHLPRSTALR
jgi:hypothetical protein